MLIELCDVCMKNHASKRFKIKRSNKYFDWEPYVKVAVCEECGEKLLGIKSNKTLMDEICKGLK